MPDFDFVGDAYTAPSIYQNAQECINWYPEIDSSKQDASFVSALGRQDVRGVVALYPTPGLLLKATVGNGPIRAARTVQNGTQLAVVSGNGLYLVSTAWKATKVGTLVTGNSPLSMSDNGLALYIVDGGNRYSYTYASGVFQVLPPSDGAFGGGDVVDICDNYFLYNRPGTQQWAASDALATTTQALSFSSKDGSSDNLVAPIVNDRQVYLLGERTSEVWTNVGTFPFPFARVPGSNSQHGLAAKYSVARLGDSFAYVGRDDRGQGMVLLMQGYSPIRISTHAIESDLLIGGVGDAIAYSYQQEGHEFYVLTLPSQDKTWVYDLRTNMWHKWLSVDANNVYHRHYSNCCALFNGLNIVGDYRNGNLYALDQNTFTDNGTVIRRVRRAPHLTADLQRQSFYSLQIQFQPGVGLQTGQGSNPQAMLRWSNDGGSTWSNEHWVSIGKVGQYRNRAIWRRLGWSRDRVYEVVVSDPVDAVIISANINDAVDDN